MLKVDGVTKYYDDFKAVDNLSFEVKKGEIFGLLGVNGAGKTTTFRMIMNLISPSKGEITWNGKKIDYSITDKIGFLTEERSLLTKLTVKEQMLFYGALKSLDEETILKRLDKLLKKFEIEEYKDRKINTLSKGNQQKVQFISAIINEPELLILDEPFSGLDPINIELFKSVILELKEKGTSIIFSSHRMDHVELFCEKLVILVRGKSVLEGYLKDIKKDYKIKKVIIEGDVKIGELKKIDGVTNAIKTASCYEVTIKDESYYKNVFNYLKTKDNITKFSLEEPSLEEIFVSKVGEAYGK
ncbi:MAG TPA: ATP-binding cassette domain-containing protein [Candidatus Aphodocola excrementigallinarum]|uniref:ATP-binding cassette domain-containing protein n=1 Tax=Candidatus Aphodocola excrementigallinarum TaxID=2840670 RepID=A0A9D1IRD7_9FIRM|nr:ATP-binding cassette domain-containing protein [Candidatus Aphodocola excrementigallinarum]